MNAPGWTFVVVQLLVYATSAGQNPDSAAIQSIKTETRKAYSQVNRRQWFLTKTMLTAESSRQGTSITAEFNGQQLLKVVLQGFNRDGAWAKEFYQVDGSLGMVYLTQEYFAGRAPASATTNFKGIRALEFRFYFKNDRLLGGRSAGYSGNPQTLIGEFVAIVAWINESSSTTKP